MTCGAYGGLDQLLLSYRNRTVLAGEGRSLYPKYYFLAWGLFPVSVIATVRFP